MSAGWVNLIVLVAIVLIVTGFVAIHIFVATRPTGQKKPGLAKPSKAHYRNVNPKTGTMF
ncbi:hypothetical protein [Neoaquamicrobium sediminum]|uniref:Uncharacterized protein n=1 Tax=Neoaquamicrobium sediminum TaxID=1849104 RepID=A0ABV3X063_9HYPH